uniref:Uncharacterized protein n=1 Tax=Populus trichocarpa TaxID=3694 RepID=A0A3N7FZR2_POPTR
MRLRIALSLISTLLILTLLFIVSPLSLSPPSLMMVVVSMTSLLLLKKARWLVEIIHTQGIFVLNTHLIKPHMRAIVNCVIAMFVIVLLHVRTGRILNQLIAVLQRKLVIGRNKGG